MDSTEATLLAAGVAAVVAVGGIWSQARSQARAARWAPSDKRLACMEALRLMVQRVQVLDPLMYEGDDWSVPIQGALEALESVERLGDRLHFLFRSEVEAYAIELWHTAHAAWAVAFLTVDRTRYLQEVEEHPGRFVRPAPLHEWLVRDLAQKQSDATQYFARLEDKADRMRGVFEPYLGRERVIGLVGAGPPSDQWSYRDPALSSRAAYAPGSPD